jgi:hypothetical protein
MHYLPNRAAAYLALIAVFSFATMCRAADFYIAQTAQGAGSGADSADAKATSFFNNSGNWSSPTKVAGKIGPGDTVHLCGTISTALTVQAGGTPGNMITVLFANGAKMSAPTWNSQAAIDIGNNSYVTVDGGATGIIGGHGGNPSLANGIIECTANGTGLANANDDKGVICHDCSNITVKGILFQNLYVRTAGGTDANKYGVGFDDYWNGGTGSTNITCTNNIFHDMSAGAFFDYAPSSATFEMSFCTAYNVNWGGAAGDHGASSTLNGLLVHDCYFYNWQTWSSSDYGVQAALHHNGFYGWAESGGTLTNITFKNNFCGPGYGTTQASAGLFISGNAGGILIYNNTLIADSTGNPGDGLIFVWVHNGNQTGARIYNNTMVGAGFGNGINVYSGNGPSITTYDVKNNLISGMGTAIARFYAGDSTLIADNNLGYNLLSGQAYSNSSSASANFMTFAQWQSAGYDAHGSSGTPNLDSSCVPQPISAAIGSGTNLSSFFTTDMAGNSRPASPAAWDIGAYQYVSASALSPVITTQPASQTVTAGSNVTFAVAASGMPTPTYQWQKDGANISGATGATLTLSSVTTADAATYSAVATNSAGSATSNGAMLTVTSTSVAPFITAQPSGQTVATGASVTFVVAASGTPTPTLQWQKNGSAVSGSTDTTFTLNGVTSADAATYTAVATNSAGSATSNGAVLTVTSAPVITTQPASQTVAAGSNVTFTVAASGKPTPTYQWKENGIAISGSTGTTFTLNGVTSANSATYTAVVTNSAGSATSNGAVLTVASSWKIRRHH